MGDTTTATFSGQRSLAMVFVISVSWQAIQPISFWPCLLSRHCSTTMGDCFSWQDRQFSSWADTGSGRTMHTTKKHSIRFMATPFTQNRLGAIPGCRARRRGPLRLFCGDMFLCFVWIYVTSIGGPDSGVNKKMLFYQNCFKPAAAGTVRYRRCFLLLRCCDE